MPFSVEAYFRDGNIYYFPETSFSEYFGSSAIDDYNFRFDANLEESGLILEMRHHQPQQPADDDFDYRPDPRGYPCIAQADTFAELLTPEESKNVVKLVYNGETIFKRINGRLVNLRLINELGDLYFDEKGTMSTLLLISGLYRILSEEMKKSLASSPYDEYSEKREKELVASQLGIPVETLDDAIRFDEIWSSSKESDEDFEEAQTAPAVLEDGSIDAEVISIESDGDASLSDAGSSADDVGGWTDFGEEEDEYEDD